jgi:peptide/nickel transport system substrate-binding protein
MHNRGMPRRRFLRFALIATGGSVLAACQLPGVAAPPRPTQISRPDQPRPGGSLAWGTSDSIEDINPISFSGFSASELLNHVLDGLVVLDANQKVYPHLATRWAIEDNARRFAFTLRDDVRFHDGTPFTAEAVKRSWERWQDPRSKAGTELLFLGPIDSIDTPDPRTLVVRFSEPNPLFLLSTWRPYFGSISPKQLDAIPPGEKIAAPIGTGPFKFSSRSADGVVTLEANKDYAWGDDLLVNRKAPFVQELRFRSIVDEASRVASLESGDSLLIDDVSGN